MLNDNGDENTTHGIDNPNDAYAAYTAWQLRRIIISCGTRTTRTLARLLMAIGEFNAHEHFREVGYPSCAGWLVANLGIARSTAYEYVRLANFLRKNPAIRRAFAAARINYTKLRLLGATITDATPDETAAHLLRLAERLAPDDLRVELGMFTRRRGDVQQQSLTLTRFDEGGGVVHIRLNEVNLQTFLAALKVGELSFKPDRDFGIPSAEPSTADGAAPGEANRVRPADPERCLQANDHEEELTPSRYGTPVAAQRFGAFLGMLNLIHANKKTTLRAPGAEVTVVITPNNQPILHSEGFAPADQITAKIFDSKMRSLLVDTHGEATNLSHPRRLASDRQVRALLAQHHGKCAAPGCDNTRWIEIHHITDWAAGGKTEMANLIPLCSQCHRMITDGLMRVDRDPHRPEQLRFRCGNRRWVSVRRMPPVRISDAVSPAVASS